MDNAEKDSKEFERALYIPDLELMLKYNKTVMNYLEENRIPFQIKRCSRDFIPYLNTRSGFFQGFEDIKRYCEALLEVKIEEGFYREPLGGKILDSHRIMHFENVSVQCAPSNLIDALLESQKELIKREKQEKA